MRTQLLCVDKHIYFIEDLSASSNHISSSYSHFSFVRVIYKDPMSVTVIPDIVNDIISVIVSRAENETSTSTSRRNITVEAKLELVDYFNQCNFPSNQTLPRHNSPGREELDAIIARFGLNRKQAARQLLIWKKSKHKIDGHIFTMSSESIASRISDRPLYR